MKLYNQMRKAYAPLLKPERLWKSLHPHDTESNEAMNQSVTKFAPKSKFAIGVFNYRHRKKLVYQELGMWPCRKSCPCTLKERIGTRRKEEITQKTSR